MLTFSAAFLTIVALLIPTIILSVYCYTVSKGWKVLLYGGLDLILVQAIQRILIPVLFGRSQWYQSLIADTALYAVLYSLISAFLEIGLFYLTLRFLLPKIRSDKNAVALGFSYGAIEGALFSGFTALSMLLSTLSQTDGTPMDYFLISAEVVCMWILHAGLALMVEIAIDQKKIVWIPAAFAIAFVLLCSGSMILTVWMQSRALLEALLAAAALAMGWWIYKTCRQDKKHAGK